MTTQEMYERYIRNILLDCYPIKPNRLSIDRRLKEDLNLDSMDMIDILCEVEKKAGVILVENTEDKSYIQLLKNGRVIDLCNYLTDRYNEKI